MCGDWWGVVCGRVKNGGGRDGGWWEDEKGMERGLKRKEEEEVKE